MPTLDLTSTNIASLSSGEVQEEYYDAGFHSPGSFGVRVNRGGRRSFFLIFQAGGKRKRVTLGHFPTVSVERARSMAVEYLLHAGTGKDPIALFSTLGRPIFFADLVEKYCREELPDVAAVSTRKEYQRIINRELLPVFRDFRVSAVASNDVKRLIESISTERGSPVMAQRMTAILRRIFNFGVEKGYIEDSPFDHLRPDRNDDDPPEVIPQTLRFLPPNDMKLLWEATREEKPIILALFRLLILTGQRPGDVLAMRWEEINGEEWRPTRRRSDSGDSTIVYLAAPAQVVLRETPGYGAAVGPVFAMKGGVPVQHIRKAAERIRKRAGLKERLSPIDLRRTVEYGMRSIGIRPDIVDRALCRKVPIRRNSGVYLGYDYTVDVRNAFRAWAQYVWRLVNDFPPGRTPGERGAGEKRPKSEGKVIQLFR